MNHLYTSVKPGRHIIRNTKYGNKLIGRGMPYDAVARLINRKRSYYRRGRRLAPRSLLRTGGLLPYPSNTEKKFADYAIADDATTTASITCVNALPTSTSASGKIGRRILMKSLQIRAHFEREDYNTATEKSIRLMVIYDRQANGTLPIMNDILTATTMVAMRNMSNVGRFYCLMDELYSVTSGNGGNPAQTVTKFLKFNLPVYYNGGTAGTIADIQTGSLLVIYFSDYAAGVDDVNCAMEVRLRFTDS